MPDAEFVPVGPRRTFEGAVAQIADRIRVGDLHEGDRLPSERDLAAQMQISRPTLREAVRVLADAGVLEVRTGAAGGIFVRQAYAPLDMLRHPANAFVTEFVGGEGSGMQLALSRLESAPGKKDRGKMAQFLKAALSS